MQIPQSGFTVKTKILSDTLGCHMRPKYLGLCKTISVNIDFICCFNLKVKFVHLYIDPNGLFFFIFWSSMLCIFCCMIFSKSRRLAVSNRAAGQIRPSRNSFDDIENKQSDETNNKKIREFQPAV